MTRLYAAETFPTATGAMADHRVSLRASEMEAFTRGLAAAVRYRTACVNTDTNQKGGERHGGNTKVDQGSVEFQ